MTSRADVCSVRVCETSLSVLELLLDLGVVTTPATSPENANSCNKDEANRVDEELSRHSHGVCIDIVARFEFLFKKTQKNQIGFHTFMYLLSLCRVFQHVGCPHGCGDSRRDPSSDFIRSQGLLLMAQLHRISGKYFRSFLRQTLTCRYTLVEVIDFLHALVGFCVDPGFVLSPISKLPQQFNR